MPLNGGINHPNPILFLQRHIQFQFPNDTNPAKKNQSEVIRGLMKEDMEFTDLVERKNGT